MAFNKILPALQFTASHDLVETENAPVDLQMELVVLKNDKQLIKKFKDKTDFGIPSPQRNWQEIP